VYCGLSYFHTIYEWALKNLHAILHSSFEERCSINVWIRTVDYYLIGLYTVMCLVGYSTPMLIKKHYLFNWNMISAWLGLSLSTFLTKCVMGLGVEQPFFEHMNQPVG
jgi:hypothetical protein